MGNTIIYTGCLVGCFLYHYNQAVPDYSIFFEESIFMGMIMMATIINQKLKD